MEQVIDRYQRYTKNVGLHGRKSKLLQSSLMLKSIEAFQASLVSINNIEIVLKYGGIVWTAESSLNPTIGK